MDRTKENLFDLKQVECTTWDDCRSDILVWEESVNVKNKHNYITCSKKSESEELMLLSQVGQSLMYISDTSVINKWRFPQWRKRVFLYM